MTSVPSSDHCTGCGGNLVEITISLDPDRPMVMRSCSTCDTRSWQRGDTVTDLHGVLDLISGDDVSAGRRGRRSAA